VLSEECDEGPGGGHLSHFELYLSAMDEMGADRRPIDGFIRRLSAGEPFYDALDDPEIPPTAQQFVLHTLRLALEAPPYEVASSFCHGRENLLPDVLGGARDGMRELLADAPVFKHYLDRHITLDHDEHGPLALALLDALCGGDPEREAQADRVAVEAVEARSMLWNGVLEEFESSGA
jgi:hypothetical protein